MVVLDELVCGIVEGLGEQAEDATLTCDIPALEISADLAIPIGLVVTELVTNAIKYAAVAGPITVLLVEEGEDLLLTVTDGGPGLPAGFDIKAASRDSLGMRMIASLSRQLRGTIAFEKQRAGSKGSATLPRSAQYRLASPFVRPERS